MKLKKKNAVVFFMIVLGVLLLIFGIIKKFDSKKVIIKSKEGKVQVLRELKEKEITNAYVDDNPIKIGIYRKSTRELLTNYTATTWAPEDIIGVFSVFATNEEKVSTNNFDTVFKSYWNQYADIGDYKIGYHIKFALNNGMIVDQTILDPLTATYMYPKVMFFVYDDANLIPDRVYSHVTQEEMTDKTLLTTVKIVGDVETKNIVGPIELTAFTYKDKFDFDSKTGMYRGKSYYTITINKGA